MDKIELLMRGESPVTLRVIDKEATIRRRPVRLDGTEICTDDIGGWEVLGHLEGPFTGAGTDIEDAAGVRFPDRGAEKIPAE
jgi:hypothetical protein